MRFTPQFLDELRARLPVSEVVGRRVKLRKAGREWKGLSPFNKEKTPSFFVNDQKQAWFDFSSGKNGNIFDFLMLTEGVSFPEAVERLAGQAGVPPRRSSNRRWRREMAPAAAATLPTAVLPRRRSLNSASAMRRRSNTRSRSISARQKSQSRT
jgi:DNA primase